MAAHTTTSAMAGSRQRRGSQWSRPRRWLAGGALSVALLSACASETSSPDTTTVDTAEHSTLPAVDEDPANVFPLSVDGAHGILVDAQGSPHFLTGDAAWSLIAELSNDDVLTYLDARQSQGFNAILVNLLEHKFSSKPPANHYGDQPFVGSQPFGQLNDAYFDRAAWVVDQARQRGMTVLLAPAYVGANGGDEGWYQEMSKAGAEQLRAYGRAVGQRFASYPNIIWVDGGDWGSADRDLVEAVAEGLAETDPAALQTFHGSPGSLSTDVYGDAPWLSVNSVYTYSDPFRWNSSARSAHLPSIYIEGAYENEHGVSLVDVREQAYAAFLAGGSGHVFGNNPMWHFTAPGLFDSDLTWQQALDSPGARSMSVLHRLAEQLPGWSSSDPVLDPPGIVAGTSGHGHSAMSADGTRLIVYLTKSADLTVALDKLAPGARSIQWIDPTTGRTTIVPPPSGGSLTLSTPGKNAAGDKDWLLVIQPTA